VKEAVSEARSGGLTESIEGVEDVDRISVIWVGNSTVTGIWGWSESDDED